MSTTKHSMPKNFKKNSLKTVDKRFRVTQIELKGNKCPNVPKTLRVSRGGEP